MGGRRGIHKKLLCQFIVGNMLAIYDQRMPLGYYDLQKSKPIQSALIEVYLQCGWLIFSFVGTCV